MRHTKIIATLGPASTSASAIDDLVVAGVDVFRLNFAHGTHESHGEAIANVRAASERHGRYVAVLQDLPGPKIRTGALRDGLPLLLKPGEALRIVAGDIVGEPGMVSTTFTALPRSVRHGDVLLLDDGRIQLKVDDVAGDEVRTTVVDGGLLGERKGINAPGVELPAEPLTAADRAALEFGVKAGVDWIALSFVRRADDLRAARSALDAVGAPDIPLIAKLERAEAVARIEEVLDAADAVMIARGDLGLELPLERVPRVQKEVTRRARAAGIPVIVATQVLESMRSDWRPTRAEVTDAATAVDQGVDAIMLAGETAVGAHPVRVVQTLDAIAREAEASPPLAATIATGRLQSEHGRALCDAAVTLSERSNATAIVAVTRHGKTARLLSALRPHAAVYAATDEVTIARRLAMHWGVTPVVVDLDGDVTSALDRITKELVAQGRIQKASPVVMVRITRELEAGPSNFLTLRRA